MWVAVVVVEGEGEEEEEKQVEEEEEKRKDTKMYWKCARQPGGEDIGLVLGPPLEPLRWLRSLPQPHPRETNPNTDPETATL